MERKSTTYTHEPVIRIILESERHLHQTRDGAHTSERRAQRDESKGGGELPNLPGSCRCVDRLVAVDFDIEICTEVALVACGRRSDGPFGRGVAD